MNTHTPAPTICSLPDELLELIAAAGQEGRVPDYQGAFNSKWKLSHVEWTMSHISRRLREVIVGAPTLWTFVEGNLEAEGSVEILKLYLERSGGCNIWAALRSLPSRADIHDVHVMEERFSLIVPHIHRIWRLTVVLPTLWGWLLAPFRDIAAPNLEHLEIASNDDTLCHSIQLFTPGAPRLIFLKMAGFITFPVPPWAASLTNLELRGRYFLDEEVVEIITQCRLLVHLYLDVSYSPTSTTRFHISSLESLHLTISDDENEFYLPRILDLFDTPAVTELRIHGAHGDQICVLFNSKSLPHVSFPVLTTMCFSSDWCEPRSSRTIHSPPLQLFPALSSLTLIKQCFTRYLVDDIVGPISTPWPLLKTFNLYPKEDDVEDVRDALLAAIRTKRQRGQPLPKFGFSATLLFLEDWQASGADAEMFHI
ncbi:hypothetical protein B0H19DRAFT_1247993 [Mycena capillaripes]|nr:hypothetical protein B0H19DRAFT_1247993 [Mycena capillaripes]